LILRRHRRIKDQRDRTAMLSPQLLELLRDWWHAAPPQAWLFPRQNSIHPVTERQINRAMRARRRRRTSPGVSPTSFAPIGRRGQS
jgi:integrase/recombinase XerD